MESRKAVSNFKSSCKALVDTIPPGHHLTDTQESIVLSNLQVIESAIRISHIQRCKEWIPAWNLFLSRRRP
jgi:hypothetical protein